MLCVYLLHKFGLCQLLNSIDNARDAYTWSLFLGVKFISYFSTFQALSQLCTYTRLQMLKILIDYCNLPLSQGINSIFVK